jgi:hypothetical protein
MLHGSVAHDRVNVCHFVIVPSTPTGTVQAGEGDNDNPFENAPEMILKVDHYYCGCGQFHLFCAGSPMATASPYEFQFL